MNNDSKDSSVLAYHIHYLASDLARHSDQILQEQLGIGFAQYKILMALQGKPGIGQKDLAGNLGQTEASVSRQMKLLRSKAMVESRVNPKNKRQHLTLITFKGQRVQEAALALLDNQHEKFFAVISPKTQRQIISDLNKLSKIHS